MSDVGRIIYIFIYFSVSFYGMTVIGSMMVDILEQRGLCFWCAIKNQLFIFFSISMGVVLALIAAWENWRQRKIENQNANTDEETD